MSDAYRPQRPAEPAVVELWLGVLAAPTAWFVHLVVSFALVGYACRSDVSWPLHAATGVAVAVAGAGGFVSWRNWRRLGRVEAPQPMDVAGRSRMLAGLGLATTLFFTLVILAAGLPDLFLPSCR